MKKYLTGLVVVVLLMGCKKKEDGIIVLDEKFSDNRNRWHMITTDSMVYNNIEKGTLVTESKIGGGFNYELLQLSSIYDPSLGHSIKTKFRVTDFYENEGSAGLVIGADSPDKLEQFYFFGINNQKEVIVAHESINEASLFNEYYRKKNPNLNSNEYNKFEFRKEKKGVLSFYLNEAKIIDIPEEYPIGNCVGFFILDGKLITEDLEVKILSL